MKLYYYKKDIQNADNKELFINKNKYILMNNFDIYIHKDYILIFNEYIKFGKKINEIIKVLDYNENKLNLKINK